MSALNRRRFLERALSLALLPSGRPTRWESDRSLLRTSSLRAALESGQPLPTSASGDPPPAPAATSLRQRFSDLDRHFIFDYYPWYGRDPWRHWDADGRKPPHDLATEYYPLLGPYDSREHRMIERHARWIRDTGAGAVCLSWWGNGSYEDRAVDRVMDVMKDHDLAITFGLEPYANDRGFRFASDVLYLLTKYGERRGWDALLVLKNADGTEGPVFKGFRCIVPETAVDCHGETQRVPDHTPDDLWQRQIDIIRRELRWDFDRLVLLADSLDFTRTPASGFDGIAIYDNFVPPDNYRRFARGASRSDLLFSFNVNPGYDELLLRHVAPDSCYEPRPFVPPAGELDFSLSEHREIAAELSAARIRDALASTLAVQNDPALSNHRRGFFLVYINSFNEWHEGHAFEPMKSDLELTLEEVEHGYHNPSQGDYRLQTLSEALRPLLSSR